MIVAVTGGAGFIGSHLVEELVKRGYTVKVVDNLSYGSLDNLVSVLKDIDFSKGDVRNIYDLRPVVREADAVIHEAALVSVLDSYDREVLYYEVNVGGTKNILELAKKYNFKVILASSCAVYGEPIELPIKEPHPLNPLSPYGWTKVRAEQLCYYYNSAFHIQTVILRYFNVCGTKQKTDAVIPKFIYHIIAGKPPVIYGNGDQTRDFIHVKDAVDATIKAMENDSINGRVFNVGTGKATTINKLARLALRLVNEDNLTLRYEPEREGDIHHSLADITLAKRVLDFKPKHSLKELVVDIYEEIKRNVQETSVTRGL